MKTALITGISGQDGFYLADMLLQKGYRVYGLVRRKMTCARHDPLSQLQNHPHMQCLVGDLTDGVGLIRIINDIKPDEIYNLAAQSHVHVSFENPYLTSHVNALGCVALLEAIRHTGRTEHTKFYQAGTSEMFGNGSPDTAQNEDTPFNPRSPYAVSKVHAYWTTRNYREAYNIFACNGILFNHESPQRDPSFVTRKITQAVAAHKNGDPIPLRLGNLNAKRDWGHARDYVEAMWRIMQHDQADDFVIATGTTTSVRDFCTMAYAVVGVNLEWHGQGTEERGIDSASGQTLVQIDPQFFRPLEVDYLRGDPSKAIKMLDWNPQKTTLEKLITEMVEHDIKVNDYT